MKHFLKPLAGPIAFALAILVFGTPSAPGAALIPGLGGDAHAYFGSVCGRAYAYQGSGAARACLASPFRSINWHRTRCNVYSGMMGVGGLLGAGGAASSLLFGVGAPVVMAGAIINGIGTGASWLSGC